MSTGWGTPEQAELGRNLATRPTTRIFRAMDADTALLIGNFDGVHLGHRALVDAARAGVGSSGRVVALAFEPHPRSVLQADFVPARLSSRDQRDRWLREAGCDEVHFLEPTEAFLSQTPEAFVDSMVDRFHPSRIVEGADFRFGRDRAGDLTLLRELGASRGFRVIEVPEVHAPFEGKQVAVHSGLIRSLIHDGLVGRAACLLERAYAIEGLVVSGDRRGRELGIPTANVDHGAFLLPADGIYAGTACDPSGKLHRAAISVGTKPTFEETPRVCEVHLLDYDGPVDDYGWFVSVRFEHWLRAQVTYDGIEPLLEQLQKDLDETRRRVELPTAPE
ncbi:MAG TPA: riboflavin biosynthesis protein RibF [Phycisphaerales bacterium]|nr:riboflavin biosynthesis protein RibF [Phycisphaerales bacterium]